MKTIRKRLEPTGGADPKVRLIPIGDIHLGAPWCREDLLRETVAYAARVGAYVIGMGDYAESATRTSQGDGFTEQIMDLDEQITTLAAILSPIRERFLGLVGGNHGRRTREHARFDQDRLLAKLLDVPYMGKGQAALILAVEKQLYRVHFWHGKSGAMTLGGKLNAAMRGGKNMQCDVSLMGHVHDIIVGSELMMTPDPTHGVNERKKTYGCTGGFYRWCDSYAEEYGYPPGKAGVLKIELFANRWDIHVSE